ncbi:MAG: carbamoyltransferase HypF, partial [Thermoanaerobaculia bacterium]
IMIAGTTGFERVATFRPIALPGGDRAIRQVWRIALALLDDAFDGAPPLELIPLFSGRDDLPVATVRSMLASSVNSPLARGVGRYFDAIGAIVLNEPVSRHEGEVALLWNMAADPEENGSYRATVRKDVTPWEIDLRLLVKEVVLDMLDGRSAAAISARFHNTIARITIAVAEDAVRMHGEMPIVLSGGCFNNALLAEQILSGLGSSHRVFMNHQIPPGDGGLALGQALVADAVVRAGQLTAVERSEVASCV